MLIYIENLDLASKVVSYLDYINTSYTLDLDDNYETVLIAQVSNKTKEIIKNKKVIFITYLLEDKIYKNYLRNNKKSRNFKTKLNGIFNKCFLIISSLEGIKKILRDVADKIKIIPITLPTINISKNNKELYSKYNISKRKKKIIIFDLDYNYLSEANELAIKYNKYEFIYIGFNQDYNLSLKNRQLLNKLANNIIKVKYIDINIFSDLLKISNMVITCSDILLNIDYFYAAVILRKPILAKNSILLESEYINSKNIYTFDNLKELDLKFSRMINYRLSNLTDETYEVIKNNTFDNIAKKYSIYLN